jgi:ketosteroid isomerase-like protein
MPTKKTARKSTSVAALIKEKNKAFGAAVAAGDATGLARMYTRNALLMPQNAPACKGTKAIAAFWQGAFGMGIRGAALKSKQVEQFGATAVEVGAFTLSAADGSVIDKGKYIVVWKKDAGQWKLHQDIFNSDGAPAGGT